MVGVPGRSKACVTCLKRKKRCDLEKPFCGTCRKARVECAGYFRPRIFINNTVENNYSQQLVKRDRIPSSGGDVAMPRELARTAYQTKYIDLFWRLYLPNGQPSPTMRKATAGGWVDAVQDLYRSESVLKKTILALSVSGVGRQENDRSLREEGSKLYASSLKELTVALKDPRRGLSDGILTAVRLASFYESVYGTNDSEARQARGWQAHSAGVIALLVMRTPYAFISGHAHGLFTDGRAHLIMSHLRGRKRCVLAEPEWKTIPWLQQEKSPRDYLIDIIAELSGIFEDLDVMKACDDPLGKERLKQQIIDSLLQMQQDLATWQVVHAPDYEIPTKVPEEVSPQQVIGCHLMTFFWATVIVVVSNFQALWEPAQEIDPIFDLDICCGNIIRSFYIMIHPAMGIFRTHLTIYPMTVVIDYIREVGPQRLLEERRILADCLCDPALAHVRQFINSLKDDIPLEFLN